MAAPTPSDGEILARIGTDALEQEGFKPSRVKQWNYRGISWEQRAKVQKIARRKGVRLPPDFLDVKRPHDAGQAA